MGALGNGAMHKMIINKSFACERHIAALTICMVRSNRRERRRSIAWKYVMNELARVTHRQAWEAQRAELFADAFMLMHIAYEAQCTTEY